MPGSNATAFVSDDSGISNLTTTDGLPDRPVVQSLESLWGDLLDSQKNRQMALEKDERFSGSPKEKAYEIAFTFPEKIEVEQHPFGRTVELDEHVRGHFDRLLNNDDTGLPLKRGRAYPDIDSLLKVCELIFIDDAMYRFAESTLFKPEPDGLESVGFLELPKNVSSPVIDDWHKDLEILWNVVNGDLAPGIEVKKEIDSLYQSRHDYIDHCRANNIFMPITVDTNKNEARSKRNIKRHIRRNNRVDPEEVHQYCYLSYQNY